ncbi:prepilin peptidase CpaA [Raoultella ornithinolytica]|uniref:Prepilin peptidase CpaA n=1 Tax=Raoultella ornithinolytica TaxID=54291 RepID=A0ABD7QPY0_RAOOR|nr:prepilin peptidase [Raoultella terrigena]ROS03920.1 prepilin peptidase CpaA [Raoultella terrigena]TCQ76588.1 prepilin peptidase CpaA [Raoultella ornithinolytica]
MDSVWLLTVGISGVLIYICYMDIRWRRIPNRATLLILLLSCLTGFTHMSYPALFLPGLLLVLGFIAAAVKLIGAGDIKLVCALAVALSASDTGDFLLLTAISGIPVSIVSLLYFYFFARDKRATVPYALAISCGYWLQVLT